MTFIIKIYLILIFLRIKKLEHLTFNILVNIMTKKSKLGLNLDSYDSNQFKNSEKIFRNSEYIDQCNKTINRSIKIIESKFILSVSSNLNADIDSENKFRKISNENIQASDINELVDEALEWIENLNKEISNLDFDNNVYEKANQRIEEISNDVKIFHDSLDAINLIEYSKSSDLTTKNDKIFCQFNLLCRNLKKSSESLELFSLFLESFKDEMKELNIIENTELNRDWSVPNKQNIVELENYRNQLSLKIDIRKRNIKQVTNMASKLINLSHPASESIENKIKTLTKEFEWIEKLLILFEIHLKNLELYSKFNLNYIELWSDLEIIDIEKMDQNKLEKMEQQIIELNDTLIQLPSFRIRKMRICDPLPNAILLVDYKTLNTSFSKGEYFKVLNNSNYLRWNVFNISKKCEDSIPSVCFIIPGPDRELKKIVENCQLKLFNIKNRIEMQNNKIIRVKPDIYFNSENKLLNELDEKLTIMLETTDNKIKNIGNFA